MTTFDPVVFKRTTKQQWEDASEAWDRWGPFLETWLGPATERMLDEAGLAVGSEVLDIAAGAGGQSLAEARRVGPSGRVLATDISPTILTYAAKAAASPRSCTRPPSATASSRRPSDHSSPGGAPRSRPGPAGSVQPGR